MTYNMQMIRAFTLLARHGGACRCRLCVALSAFAALAAAPAVRPAPAAAAVNVADLTGTVTRDGRPVPSVAVTASGNGALARTASDARGTFRFASLQFGTYLVVATQGTERAERRVDLGSSGASVTLDFGAPRTIGAVAAV